MAHEEVNLGHGLKDEIALFAALERNSVLTQGLWVVALASECEPAVVSRELALARHLELRPSALFFRRARTAALDRQIGVRARERGIQRDRQARRRLALGVTTDVAEHEPHEVQRVVILGIELQRTLERRQRFL